MLKCGALCALLAMGKGDQMEWFEAVDGYCERVDAAFWSEPINAVTNAAFLIAAIWAWRRPDLPVIGWLISDWEYLGSTRGYVPVPILILIYAYLLQRKLPDVARGLTIGVGILLASMGARWADEPLCHMHPMGTHFLWHILNAVMLAWMIEVYRRHMLAGRRAKR